jgi:hypothetical protein
MSLIGESKRNERTKQIQKKKKGEKIVSEAMNIVEIKKAIYKIYC